MLIESEITKLQRVILHKPRLALKHLTPSNCRTYLFNDALWVDKAQEEHDHFEIILRHNGCEVFLLHDLLAETLENSAAKNWLLTKRIHHLRFHSEVKNDLFDFLNETSSCQLTDYLLGGLTLQESGFTKKNLCTFIMKDYDFLIPPLPHHIFPRDISTWIGSGVIINSLYYSLRRAESLNIAAIYKFHPLFKDTTDIWFNGIENDFPSIEGGDILVLNENVLLIGLGQYTHAEAIEILARTLFAAGVKNEILVLGIPKMFGSQHLETLLSMISHDTFATAFLEHMPLRAWRLRPDGNSNLLSIEIIKDFYHALAQALKIKKINLIGASGDYFEVQREQGGDSANLLAIAPGRVVAYDRNVGMNRKLRKAGIVVYEIPSAELSRGRGGVRSLSCPLLRKKY